MQRRFEALAWRSMREEDYQAWLAFRVVGEAVMRTRSDDPLTWRAYVLGLEFEIAAFEGGRVTFRAWSPAARSTWPTRTTT